MKKFFINLNAWILSLTSNTHTQFAKILLEKKLKVATAESCTGGLISSRLTDISGSSAYTNINFITYSNKSKHEFLEVSNDTLENFGAVSKQCAQEMSEGLMNKTNCDISICTTGVAGPNTDEGKNVGLIYIAISYKTKTIVKELEFTPLYSRKNMKFLFSENAIKLAIDTILKY